MSDAISDHWHLDVGPQGRRVGARGLLVLLSLAFVLVGSLLIIRAYPTSVTPDRPEPPPAPVAPTWLDIIKPVQIYNLEAPILADAPIVYSARRRSTGGGREDTLTFGVLGDASKALTLRIARQESDPMSKPPLYAVFARRAADAGQSIDRVGPTDLMPTRFGAFEIAAVTLATTGEKTPSGACEGFRLALDQPGLAISGLACGGTRPFSQADLACLIDRLDLASGGEDRTLIDFFAASELRRDGACRGIGLSPDKVHAAWLDDKPSPPPATPQASSRPASLSDRSFLPTSLKNSQRRFRQG